MTTPPIRNKELSDEAWDALHDTPMHILASMEHDELAQLMVDMGTGDAHVGTRVRSELVRMFRKMKRNKSMNEFFRDGDWDFQNKQAKNSQHFPELLARQYSRAMRGDCPKGWYYGRQHLSKSREFCLIVVFNENDKFLGYYGTGKPVVKEFDDVKS